MQNMPNMIIKPCEVGPILGYSLILGCIIRLRPTKPANTIHTLIRDVGCSLPKNSLAKAAINIILAKSDNNFAVNSLNLFIAKDSISFEARKVNNHYFNRGNDIVKFTL